MEDSPPYPTGPTDRAEPPLTTEALIAAAHAHHQGIPYETGEPARPPAGRCAPWPIYFGRQDDRQRRGLRRGRPDRPDREGAGCNGLESPRLHAAARGPAARPPETARPQTPGSGKP